MTQRPQNQRKGLERAFTHADVAKYWQELWGKDSEPTNELLKVSLFPGIRPGGWEVLYRSTYHDPGGDTHTRDWTILVLQFDGGPMGPWLNVELPVDLPAGLPSPQDEDTEIKRREEAKMAEWRRQREEVKQAQGDADSNA